MILLEHISFTSERYKYKILLGVPFGSMVGAMARQKASKPKELQVRDWPAIRAFRRLLRAQARVVELHREFLSAEHGLSLGEFDMIAELGNTEGLRMGDLARKMITSPANVTRLATRLESRGLVLRRRAKASDREVVAALTEAGEAFFADHFRDVVGFTREVMTSALDPAELETLAVLCERVFDDARGRVPDADGST